VIVLVATGGGEPRHPRASGPTPTATATSQPHARATPTPATSPDEPAGDLAVGLTEPNPALYGAAPVAQPFEQWREAVSEMAPTYYRLVIDWASVASPDGRSLDLGKAQPGCMRDKAPCAGWGGVRAQLQALAAAQRAHPGRMRGLIVFTGTPAGLAQSPHGCERAGTMPRSRPPTATGLSAYADAVRAVLDAAQAAGADVPYWSPWNEPNHPYFISPQRSACSASAPSLAPAAYTKLARTMAGVLDGAPGDHLVLGELAGLLDHRSSYTDVASFVRALPRSLVCRASVWGQHGYVGGSDPVDALTGAIRRFHCPRAPDVWITETGVRTDRASPRHACRAIHGRLARWYRDPRVTAAFQYTVRDDDMYPTGLVTTDLAHAYPMLAEWRAWGRRAHATSPPPKLTC
jgi:hypothetical protein